VTGRRKARRARLSTIRFAQAASSRVVVGLQMKIFERLVEALQAGHRERPRICSRARPDALLPPSSAGVRCVRRFRQTAMQEGDGQLVLPWVALNLSFRSRLLIASTAGSKFWSMFL
jgi:hypothetical protein